MIVPLSIVSFLALLCLGLLASPWPFLAPFAVLGLVGFTILYRRPAWGLLAITAIVPFEGFFKESSLPAAKLIGASMGLVLMLQMASRQLSGQQLQSNLWRLLGGFALMYLLSLLCSDYIPVSIGHLREMIIGLVLFVLTLAYARDMNLNMFCRLISLSVAITCALAMFSTKYQEQGRALGLFADANSFAMLIAFAVPLSLLQVLKSPNNFMRIGWALCSLVMIVGMTKTQSRSGLVVLLISLLIGIYHYRVKLQHVRPRHLGFVMLAFAILVPTAISVVPPEYVARIKSLAMLKSGVNAHQDESLSRRASYVVVGAKMIREQPILGSGPGTFPIHYANSGYAKAFTLVSQGADELYRRAHNTYLEIFSELGIPAGLFFVGLIAASLHNMLKARTAWLQRHDDDRADMATHLGMSLLSLSLFLMFLSIPNLKYLWIMFALSSVLRLQAERSPMLQPAQEAKA
ncbi:O-Antigen ligase [compost metagenome]